MTRDDLKRFRELDIDFSDIGLKVQDGGFDDFFTPVGAERIGGVDDYDDAYFVLLPGDERVFRVLPSIEGSRVEPVGGDLREFLSFGLYCEGLEPLVEVCLWKEDSFRADIADRREDKELVERGRRALAIIANEFDLTPADPFERVKALIADFDPSILQFSDDYYDVLGLDRPE